MEVSCVIHVGMTEFPGAGRGGGLNAGAFPMPLVLITFAEVSRWQGQSLLLEGTCQIGRIHGLILQATIPIHTHTYTCLGTTSATESSKKPC